MSVPQEVVDLEAQLDQVRDLKNSVVKKQNMKKLQNFVMMKKGLKKILLKHKNVGKKIQK
jgi:hypothetical protein